jgi:hypothetical protein
VKADQREKTCINQQRSNKYIEIFSGEYCRKKTIWENLAGKKRINEVWGCGWDLTG